MTRRHPYGDEMELTGAFPCYFDPGYHFPPHLHERHELILIQQGLLRVRLRGKEYVAQPRDVLLYTAGSIHEEWVDPSTPLITWICILDGEGFTPNEPVLRHDFNGHMVEIMAKLNKLFVEDFSGGGNFLHYQAVLQDLLAEFHILPHRGYNAMVDRVRAFVRCRLNDQFSVASLADVVDLSPPHFARQYKKITGRTPMEDIRYIRVEEAARLIAQTDLPLHEIAPLVGMYDAHHLSRHIKALLGVTVRELRHAHGPRHL